MKYIRIKIVRFVDDAQPGWVEAELIDAWKRKWTFVEKIPSFTDGDVDEESDYPVDGVLESVVVGSYLDRDDRLVAVVRTEPESTDRTQLFEVEPELISDAETGEVGIEGLSLPARVGNYFAG